MTYIKVWFQKHDRLRNSNSPDDRTAGLILETDKFRKMTVESISRLFPYSECGKMEHLMHSPEYKTWEDAFNHDADTLESL